MRLQFVEAGEIVSTHGIKGEMKVLPWVDGPEILCEFDRCRISGKEYEIVESDWSSDVCSSDLHPGQNLHLALDAVGADDFAGFNKLESHNIPS